MSLPALLAVCNQLITMTRSQRAELGPMHEGRVDVIGGGAIVVEELAAALAQRAGIDHPWSVSTTFWMASRCPFRNSAGRARVSGHENCGAVD